MRCEELGILPETDRDHATSLPLPHAALDASAQDDQSPSQKLLPLWNVPYLRNPFFTGREYLLEHMHTQLRQDNAVVETQLLALSGLGGIGKTQTAVEYAYRHVQDYSAIFWVTAQTPEDLLTHFAALSVLLQLPERTEPDQRQQAEAVCRWLASHQNWLLIFDNVEDLDAVKQVPLPTRGGALLLTTRRQSLGAFARPVELERMGMEEGAHLLLRRARWLDSANGLRQVAVEEMTLAQKLVELLEGLPLALDQAGAYLQETQCSLEKYLQLYQRAPLMLLGERERSADHPTSVVNTFALAFQRVQQYHPAATDLLGACVFLAPDAIPEELLLQATSQVGSQGAELVADPLQYQAALKVLLSSSLIHRQTQARTLSIHRLVQLVLRAQMTQEEQQARVHGLIRALDQLFPSERLNRLPQEQWTTCEQLMPHAFFGLSWGEPWAKACVHLASLLEKMGNYLHDRAHATQAEPLLQRALLLHEQLFGPSHVRTAQGLNSLAEVYWSLGRYTQAELPFQRAFTIREQVLGPQHPDTAESLSNLGTLYKGLGQYAQAEPLLQRALTIREQVLGSQHPDTATSLNQLGVLFMDQGQYVQAEPLLQRALTIREQVLGSQHLDTTTSLNNLGILYEYQERYAQAEPLLQRALTIREQVLGSQHPDTATSLHNLGILYWSLCRYTQAESLLQQALTIREQVIGSSHPHTAISLANLGTFYECQGSYTQAEPLLQRASQIAQDAWGSEHPLTRRIQKRLANLERELMASRMPKRQQGGDREPSTP